VEGFPDKTDKDKLTKEMLLKSIDEEIGLKNTINNVFLHFRSLLRNFLSPKGVIVSEPIQFLYI
jgi:hypothetical protein